MGKWLRALIEEDWLMRQGRSHPVYKPSLFREVSRTYLIQGLDEQAPWERDFSPCFDLPPKRCAAGSPCLYRLAEQRRGP